MAYPATISSVTAASSEERPTRGAPLSHCPAPTAAGMRTLLRFADSSREIKNALSALDSAPRHFAPYVKSSNSVTLSALVQTPTLPASLNVSSSHSIAFLASKVTVK